MTKKITSIITSISLVGCMFAQGIEPDARLETRYSKKELATLKAENPKELAFKNYCIDNAFEIMPFPEEKRNDSQIRGSIKINNIDKINFYELEIALESDNRQYYSIEGTKKMLVIYSKKEIKHRMKNKQL